MKTISLGSQGLTVSELGYGCMGLTTAYGKKQSDEHVINMLEEVYKQGVTFWDTANLYCYPDYWRLLSFRSPVVCQEELIGQAIQRVGRSNVTIATKTGVALSVFPTVKITANGARSFIRKQCEDSLSRLGVDYIDLFYLHRIDQNIPIEISMMEMKALVDEGKVKYVGLSECSAKTIRRAHKIHPLTAVQMEYSLWCRGIEEDLLETCKELGIGLVAYSPLGRGFFGQKSTEVAKYAKGDYRAGSEKLTGEAGKQNLNLLAKVEAIAQEKHVSTAQLALAWVQKQQFRIGDAGVVAIPGTTKVRNLESNVGSVDIDLSGEEVAALEAAVPSDEVKGSRYEQGAAIWESDKNRELTEEEARDLGL